MKTKRIQLKDIQVGMKIKSYDPHTNSIVFNNVESVWDTVVPAENQRHLTFNNGVEVHCSSNHPIMAKRGNVVLQIYPDDITPDDIIITDAGHTTLKSLELDSNNPGYIDITVEDTHTFFASNDDLGEMVLTHNSQGGVRGGAATLHYPAWHLEIEDLIVLKNNKGTEDNRIRHLDYSVQFNKVMYERLLDGGEITLFSPNDCPDLYEAFFRDVDEFRTLYEKYERSTKIRKKTISAIDLFSAFMQERKDTGRIYFQNVDHCNDHGSFRKEVAPIRMSNLCLSGDTWLTVRRSDGDLKDMRLVDVVNSSDPLEVLSRNVMTGVDQFKKITARALTSPKASVVRITDDRGCSIVCTPEHKVYTKNRGYVMARDLDETDELQLVE